MFEAFFVRGVGDTAVPTASGLDIRIQALSFLMTGLTVVNTVAN